MKLGKRRYAVMFSLLSVSMAAAACSASLLVPWLGVLMIYASLSFTCMSIVYRSATSNLILQKSNGRLSTWSWLLLGPYFLLSLVTFQLYRLFARGPAYAEVIPNLYFGRRLTGREVRAAGPLGWQGVLDLALEFSETRALRKLPGYRSFPLLDATAPSEEMLKEAIEWLSASMANGPVYVHCAFGHGRSACVVIGYLLSAGLVKTVDEGEKRLRALRHGVHLNADQRQVLEKIVQQPMETVELAPAASCGSSSHPI